MEYRFDYVWDRLADQGKCDSRGGAEYVRVRREWHDAGAPVDLEAFIIRRANLDPYGREGVRR